MTVDVPDIEPEAARAERHKAAIHAALLDVVEACEAARLDGFYAEFGVNLSPYGRYVVAPPVGLIKRF